MQRHILLAGALLIGALSALPAHADAIDGDWCSPEGGKSLTIDGPNIRTPGGARISGRYTRHTFSYISGENDPDPGSAVDIILMGETRARVQVRGGTDSIWRRCPAGTS